MPVSVKEILVFTGLEDLLGLSVVDLPSLVDLSGRVTLWLIALPIFFLTWAYYDYPLNMLLVAYSSLALTFLDSSTIYYIVIFLLNLGSLTWLFFSISRCLNTSTTVT